MNEPFAFTTTCWELTLLLGVMFLGGSYMTLVLLTHRDPDRQLPKRQGDIFEEVP